MVSVHQMNRDIRWREETKINRSMEEKWRRRWHPTPLLLPGKSHGQRSLVGCSPWGREESDTTEWLPFTFHFHVLEKGMATHSSILAWRIPGTGEPGGLPSVGSHRVGHDWSNLAAAAAWKKKKGIFENYIIIYRTKESMYQLIPAQQEVARETAIPLFPKNWVSHLLRGECQAVRIGKRSLK